MNLAQAEKLAQAAKIELVPYCGRIEIAGSIRRKKPEVRDIELVCIPRGSTLMQFVDAVNRWPRIKGSPKGKYTQREYRGVKLDLFICTPKTWACNFVIRTGSADFSHALAIRARSIGVFFKEAQLWYLTPSDPTQLFPLAGINKEIDVFRALKIEWVDPEKRLSASDIIPL